MVRGILETIKRRIVAAGLFRSLAALMLLAVALSHLVSLFIAWITGNMAEYFDHSIYMATIVPLVVGPPTALVVLHLLIELEKSRGELEIANRMDALTGIYNRRHFYEEGAAQIARAAREGTALTIAILDLDHFKRINDSYGHQAGDAVLTSTVARCQACIRAGDIFARLGGEEFAILMPATSLQQARFLAERMRSGVAGSVVETGEEAIRVTVSLGLAEWRVGDSLGLLLKAADECLYAAKQAGRDRVVAALPGNGDAGGYAPAKKSAAVPVAKALP